MGSAMRGVAKPCDSLDADDRTSLAEAVRLALPSYGLSWHVNADAMVWAVLEQRDGSSSPLRFTICRLDHALMLMIEAGTAARQFYGAASVTDAVAVACGIARETLAGPTPDRGRSASHDAPLVLQ